MLTDEQITKFQELYRVFSGEEISRIDVVEKGVQLVRLLQLAYKPMTQIDLERVLSRQEVIGVESIRK